MITFLDENDVEYGALATIKATNAVNGERSLTGTIVSGDYVLSNIERGWRLRFDDEYYVVTYAKPIDEGRDVQVEFDAVHQFFWDFDKSSVYDQLADGSHTFVAYLDFIFKNSGYSYTVDTALNVHAFEKQSFGFKKRLTLFNDIITSTGVEFQVNGKVVRILEKVGTDLSTVVRKNFNMNELTIEKNIGDFVTYQKGFGAYFDEEDHSKGRLEVEYTSPLASVYGKLEAEPFVDERYSQSSSLLAVLKENVDNSYTISVSLDMEDLTRAGYKYKQPVAGDYIMAINETLDFQEKIRIVSFTSEYAVDGQLIKHTVTCNDIGSVKKLSASYNLTKKQAASASDTASNAYSIANKALISADGKNTNYYGDTFPVDNPKGTLKKGDLLFLTVGDTVKQYYWNGADWVINPVLDDVEAFKEQITNDLKDVPNREEFENKIAEELANSKAEIETQIESAKTQAESNAKEYADTINQETAKVAELANAAAGEIKADLVNVKDNLTATSIVANSAQAAADAAKRDLANVTSDLNTAKQDLANSVAEVNTKVDDAKAELTQTRQQLETVRNDSLASAEEAKQGLTAVNAKVDSAKAELTQAKQDLTNVANDLSKAKTDLQNAVSEVDTKAANLQSDLSKAKQDLTSHAQQLQTQASAQSELTKRVSSVEKTANGTKTTVSELSKTVAQNGKDITSVTNRTKTVEDDLANTKTTLTQVQTTANSTSQKTATLETGLNGLSAKFSNLKIGGTNLLLYSADPWQAPSGYYQSSGAVRTDEMLNGSVVYKTRSIWSRLAMNWGKHLIDRPDVKAGDEFTYSVYVRTDQESPIKARLFFRYSGQSNAEDMTGEKTITQEWQRFTKTFTVTQKMVSDSSKLTWVGFEQTSDCEDGKFVYYACNKLERGNVATDYSLNDADLEQKVAEYKQTADQNYASLQTTVQNLDGTVQHNKTVADQTAAGFKTRIESLETYKDGESERANAYFESAKTETAKQLTAERTAIAKDYVAKSTYTSDVTGIRNELSATTSTANATKTNLANYQASNDKMVASLKSSLQTTDGNVSNLQTKVEAVPGQITSAVSAVEGKIPTSAGGRNLALGTSGDWSGDWTNFNGQNNQTRTIYRIYNRGLKVGDKVNVRLVLKYSDIVAADGQTAKISLQLPGNVTVWGAGGLNGGQAVYLSPDDNEAVLSGTTTITDNHLRNDYWNWGLRVDYVASGRIQWKEAKAEAGDLPTPWSPAPEDTAEQISNLSSQIQQTADGITLLATKTELNSAKNELQSGITTATNKANSNAQTISTHTTQISALNTGLQAKVSQSDFNTLSGRVTTAENNITAKANELSSKITSVEGKIPTSSGGRNLAQGTSKDWSEPFTKFKGTENTTIGLYRVLTDGLSVGDTLKTRIVLKYTDIVPTSGKTAEIRLQGSGNVTNWSSGCYNFSTFKTISGSGELVFEHEFKITADHLKNSYWSLAFRTNWIASGSLQWKLAKVERGMFFTDWSPAPEDTAEQISNLSSEIKQTADGMTLLATKTELNNAKNELQSGISTATSKADNAQASANSNAQTISTHTTQISALNTGLQAKVSQTDFNTLSGRVTTAENNITAKANELSSKISSVEGKIPTEIGAKNLIIKSTAKIGFRLSADGKQYQDQAHSLSDWIKVEPNTTYTLTTYEDVNEGSMYYSLAWYSTNNADYSGWISRPTGTATSADLKGGKQYQAPANAKYAKVSYPTKYAKFKFERGKISTDYTPAPEDTAEQIDAVSSELKQTADGMTLLATKTEVNSAKSELQSGINTATNKANTAQSTADGAVTKANNAQNTADGAVTKANSAQNKANSNAQTISTHTTQISALNTGLQAKVSQSDFNTLSGRVTTAENNITAKANELSSKITKVEGKIPTNIGTVNLIVKSTAQKGLRLAAGAGPLQDSKHELTDWIKVEPSTVYTLTTYEDVNEGSMYYSLAWYSTNNSDYSGWISRPTGTLSAADLKGGKQYTSPANAKYAKVSYPTKYAEVKFERGNIATDYNPNPDDYDAALTKAQSEIKQTTDAIKASVSSLDNSTVKSSSLTINADGIVMKAGSSTTDVANAIGSYFGVNQNAINLFSDKINVKGNMIVSGAITSDKIASKQINTSHLNGKIITADVIATNAITADAIKAGAVTTDKMSANSINGDRITAGTLDAAKIKAGSITASQIASGTITSNQIKTGGISSANIAAGAITTDKIAAGAIDANKIAANAITANMIRGGQLNSTNGATSFDLNAGTLTFNNNYGYIQRVASDKVFEITTWLHSADANSPEYLTSAFKIRKSDNSRRSGAEFTLNNTLDNKPTASAIINADSLTLSDSQSRTVLSIFSKGNFGNINMQGWGDIPVAQLYNCGLVVKDIGIGGHFKSLLAIVEELCKKANIPWV